MVTPFASKGCSIKHGRLITLAFEKGPVLIQARELFPSLPFQSFSATILSENQMLHFSFELLVAFKALFVQCSRGESFANSAPGLVLMGAVSKAALVGPGLNFFKRQLQSAFGFPKLQFPQSRSIKNQSSTG